MAFADDYIGVSVRIAEFYEKYPEGSIQTEIVTHTDTLVVVKAYAFRTDDDRRPATGHSQLGIPGKTSFTRDSEVENCETSAVGRALAFLGFAAKESIASREEVEMKAASQGRAGSEASSRQSRPAETNGTPKRAEDAVHPAAHAGVQAIHNIIKAGAPQGMNGADVKEATAMALGARPSELNKDIFNDFLGAWLEQPGNTATAFQKKFLAALEEIRRHEAAPA